MTKPSAGFFSNHYRLLLFWSAGTTAGYFLSGLAGLALAIPPGYATAIFPAAGIAVFAVYRGGYRLLPAVWLGSFLMNSWTTVHLTQKLDLATLLLPSLIALGAATQAAWTVWLLRRCLRAGSNIGSGKDIVILLGLGGPIGCIAGATVGVTALFSLHLLTVAELAYSWWTWWVGDTIGVLIMLPILLCILGRPREIWKPRRITVATPLALSSAAMVILFLYASNAENRQIEADFRERATRVNSVISQSLENQERLLHQFERGMAAVGTPNQQAIDIYGSYATNNYPGLIALAWIDEVSDADRAQYEARLGSQAVPWHIRERNASNVLIPATRRKVYYPLRFVTPRQETDRAVGFDIGSDAARARAVEDAINFGEVEVTPPLQPIQSTSLANNAVLAILRVGAGKRGLVSMAIRIPELVNDTLSQLSYPGLMLQIRDQAKDGSNTLLYQSTSSGQITTGTLRYSVPLHFGNRNWNMEVIATSEYMASKRSLQAWLVLAGGLLFCAALGAFLLLITGRTAQIEQMVISRTRQLANREQYLSAVMASVLDGILTLRADGRIDTANTAATQMLKASERLAGRQLSELLPLKWGSVVERTDTEGFSQYEVEVTDWENKVLPLEAYFTVLEHNSESAEQEPTSERRYVCSLHDLSERQRSDRLKREFVSTVSHELRTPLTSIRGSLGLLVGGVGGTLNPAADQMLKIAYQNTERLLHLINDLLDVEKLDFGKLDFKLESQPLPPLLMRSISENAGYASQYQVGLVLEDQSNGTEVTVDSARFAQVLSNLLSNAVKFSRPGGEVILRATSDNDAVHIAVIDHGEGIPPAFRERLFSKFAQADGSDTRRHAGTGLGLYLCKLLIEGMGGTISCTSEIGRGSTFTVDLARSH